LISSGTPQKRGILSAISAPCTPVLPFLARCAGTPGGVFCFAYSGFCEMPTGEPGEHLPGQLSGEQSKTALFSGFVRGSLISSRARWGVGICDNLGGFRGSIRRRPGAAVPPPLPVNISPISRQNPTNLTGCQTSKIPTTKNPNRENCPACEKLGVLWVCRGIARGKKTRPRPVGP